MYSGFFVYFVYLLKILTYYLFLLKYGQSYRGMIMGEKATVVFSSEPFIALIEGQTELTNCQAVVISKPICGIGISYRKRFFSFLRRPSGIIVICKNEQVSRKVAEMLPKYKFISPDIIVNLVNDCLKEIGEEPC